MTKKITAKIIGDVNFYRCERCGAELDESKIVWLTFDQRTSTSTDQPVPEEFSQGAFPFGRACAKQELKEHASKLAEVVVESALVAS